MTDPILILLDEARQLLPDSPLQALAKLDELRRLLLERLDPESP